MIKEVSYKDAVKKSIFTNNQTKKLVVVIPAHNEQLSLPDTLTSLAEQYIPDNLEMDVFIALDNCTDKTKDVVSYFKDSLNIYLYETVDNNERKAGALNQIYQLFFGNKKSLISKTVSVSQQHAVNNIQAFFGIDADVYLGFNCIKTLWDELQSKFNIASVSANYTCLLPENPKKVPLNTPNRESIIKKGKYGGPFARLGTFAQNMEFADWTIQQKSQNHIAQIAGGQATMFRFDIMKQAYDTLNINGIYDNTTDTEDLALTQEIRKMNWTAAISESARCYVDSMRTLASYNAQRTKWVSGTVDYMLKDGIKTKYSRLLWGKEMLLLINLFIRIMLIVLIPSSLLLHMFQWNWIWILPIILASLTNTIISLKTPNHRLIDVFLSFLNILPEIYLWITLKIHVSVWISKLKIGKTDAWAAQYQAEQGKAKRSFVPLITIIVLAVTMFILFKFNIVTEKEILLSIKPHIISSFNLLTELTVVMVAVMLFKLLKYRGNFKA